MISTAEVLDLESVERDAFTAPVHLVRTLDRFFVEFLHQVRQTAPFRALTVVPWSVLVQLATRWIREDSLPTPEDLAAHSGCSTRSVRRAVADFKRDGVVVTVRRPDGLVGYGIGRSFASALGDFAVGREDHVWIRRPRSAALDAMARRANTSQEAEPAPMAPLANSRGLTPVDEAPMAPLANGSLELQLVPMAPRADSSSPAGAFSMAMAPPSIAPRPPRPVTAGGMHSFAASVPRKFQGIRVAAQEAAPLALRSDAELAPQAAASPDPSLLIKEIKLRSSSSLSGETAPEMAGEANAPEPAVAPAPSRKLDATGIRLAACRALGARYVFGRPERSVPESFSLADVDTVVRVTAGASWTEAELDQTHRDAILGASLQSKAQPPTVGYIWGKQEFFDQNVRKGREKRKESEPVVRKPPKPKPPEEPPASFEEVARIAAEAVRMLSGPCDLDVTRPRDDRFLLGSKRSPFAEAGEDPTKPR